MVMVMLSTKLQSGLLDDVSSVAALLATNPGFLGSGNEAASALASIRSTWDMRGRSSGSLPASMVKCIRLKFGLDGNMDLTYQRWRLVLMQHENNVFMSQCRQADKTRTGAMQKQGRSEYSIR
uniref:Uncharacterized protein n=1 Tax=Oryza barthii TaxID=65489 RepID=A0A0D3G9H4_9ORYZ